MRIEPSPIKWKILAPALVMLFVISFLFILSIRHIGIIHSQEEMSHHKMGVRNGIRAELERHAKLMSAVLDHVERDKDLQLAWMSRDDTALFRHATPFFQMSGSYDITHFYFISTDKICRLRLHNPEQKGDTIRRFTLDMAINTAAQTHGIELGPLGTLTLRTVRPWKIDGKVVGYLELGEEIHRLTPTLKKILGCDLIFIVNKANLDRATWETGRKLMGKPGNWKQFSSFTIASSTLSEIPPALSESIQRYSERENENVQFELPWRDHLFEVGAIPLVDAGTREVGKVIILTDRTESTARLMRILLYTTLGCVLASVLFFGTIHKLLSRIDSRLMSSQEALQESEEKFRTLYDSSRDAVMMLTPEKGFFSGNPATIAMFACKDEKEFTSKTPADLSPLRQPDGKESAEKAREMMTTATANGSHFFEWRHKRLDGTEFPATVLLTRMSLSGRSVLQATVRDITLQKRMEEQLRQSEKMQAIGQLAGGIAHDFNNRLVSIQGYAELLYEETENKHHRDFSKRIVQGAKRAARLTKQLLSFARKGSYQSVPVNLHSLIAETVTFLEHSIDKQILVRQHLNACKITTTGDPAQLQNVLLNLALNARDAMPDGGELTFETEVMRPSTDSHPDFSPELTQCDCIKLSISDTGVGIDEETQKHIFEPFFTTKSIGEGTGMGLASAYGTIHSHGGAITVESNLGKGSTFAVYLPISEAKEDAKKNLPASTTMGIASILIVDDEADVLDFVGVVLRKLGYEVFAFADGSEAVDYYRNEWRRINLVILDMIMPKMDGRQTFIAMAEINPNIRAILSTGYSLNSKTKEALDEGILALVQKPFNIPELSEKVAQILLGGNLSAENDSLES